MAEENAARQAFILDLRKARDYQHVDLELVASETHISIEFLEALESGAWECIPAPFLRGYLTAYAECIGMVRDKVLKRFDELGYQPPTPLRPRAEDVATIPQPVIRIPFAMAQRQPETANAPSAAPAPRPTPVPSLWEVVPFRHKFLVALSLGLVFALLFWVLIRLMLGQAPNDGAELPTGLPAIRPSATEATPPRGFEPFDVRLELRSATRLRIMSQDGLIFNGACPADSAIRFTSTTDVIIQAEQMAGLKLWRDNRIMDLQGESGAAEIRLNGESVNIIRRSP